MKIEKGKISVIAHAAGTAIAILALAESMIVVNPAMTLSAKAAANKACTNSSSNYASSAVHFHTLISNKRSSVKDASYTNLSNINSSLAITYGTADLANQAGRAAAAQQQEQQRAAGNIPAKTILVRQNGTGNYSSIQAAVDAAYNGDTIIIGAGIYPEDVNNRYKVLNIVGETGNPNDIVIRGNGSDYLHAPLEMCAGTLKNLTVYSSASGSGSAASAKTASSAAATSISAAGSSTSASNAGTPTGNAGAGSAASSAAAAGGTHAYALHDDFPSASGHTFTADHVNFISEMNAPLGMGTKPGSITLFTGCTVSPSRNQGSLAMTFYDAASPSRQLPGNGFAGSSDFVLTANSSGNSLAILNAQ